jgi:hypothetical protein
MTRPDDEPYERAKLPMILAAVGVVAGLAIAGSVERSTGVGAGSGGAIVLGAWVLGIAALHRLGRAGSVDRRHANVTEARPAKADATSRRRE